MRILVITGLSGAGKTTVADLLLQGDLFERVITTTTRDPRPGEVNGEHYHFVTPETFAQMECSGEFLESADVYGQHYGSSLAAVRDIHGRGCSPLMILDIQGATSIKHSGFDCYIVGLFASPNTLGERLRARGGAFDEIERRINGAGAEMAAGELLGIDRWLSTENSSPQLIASMLLESFLS